MSEGSQAEAALCEEIYLRLCDLAETDQLGAINAAYNTLVNFISSFGPKESRDEIVAAFVESLSDDVEEAVRDAKPYHDA